MATPALMTESLQFSDVQAAAVRLVSLIRRTPVLVCDDLDRWTGGHVFLKCENFQQGGAFKLRGASNALEILPESVLRQGVATHSSGNHAAALALAAQRRGVSTHVVMPRNASATKRAAAAALSAYVVECEPTMAAREAMLKDVIATTGAVEVHPYDDYRVMAGQGTAALELFTDVPDLDMVLAPVGGGGLMSGTAVVARHLRPGIKVIGAEPAGADDAQRSFRAGRVLPVAQPDTIADGLRATVGENTLPILCRLLDDIVTVDDAAIVRAMRYIWERMKIIIEPSSAVPIAVLLEKRVTTTNLRIGVIISGGNVGLDHLPW
jgi:Threonine dehydratase